MAKLDGRTKLTKTGATAGTIYYVSPEQACGNPVDHRIDIWAPGVVLYEMLTGKSPFDAEYDAVVVYLIFNENPPTINSIRHDIPMEIAHLVNKYLSKDPTKRYQSVSDLQAEIEE